MLKAGALILFAALATPPSIPPSQPHQQTVRVESSHETDSSRQAAKSGQQSKPTAPQVPPFHKSRGGIGAAEKCDYECQRRAEERSEYWVICGHRMKITDLLLVIFNFLIVIVGGITAAILKSTDSSTAKNAKAALLSAEAASISAEALRAQYRAYVKVSPRGGEVIDNVTGKIRLYIDIENVGQTPAFQTETMWGIQVRPHQQKPILIDADKKTPKVSSVLYPHTPSASGRDAQLTNVELNQINAGTHDLYVFGQVTFRDADDERQYAAFSAYLDKVNFTNFIAAGLASGLGTRVHAAFKFSYFMNHASISEDDWDADSGVAPIEAPHRTKKKE
jgi:hypothetical protein